MKRIAIDEEKCIGCGQCVKNCGTSVLYLENGKAKAKEDGCVECGHCFVICPKAAISMPEYDCSDCDRIGSFSQFEEDEMLLALKSRRTIRHFKDQTVSEEQICKIIEAGRYSPTATIIISAKKGIMDHFGADVNGALATAHMETQAESMGLGVLVSGFTIISMKISRKARKIIGLEKGEKPVACLVIGYPSIEHRRIPPRKKAKIRILK